MRPKKTEVFKGPPVFFHPEDYAKRADDELGPILSRIPLIFWSINIGSFHN